LYIKILYSSISLFNYMVWDQQQNILCHVSNGVINSNGSVVQMGEYVLRVKSKFM
jgi:hypothetical protein